MDQAEFTKRFNAVSIQYGSSSSMPYIKTTKLDGYFQ